MSHATARVVAVPLACAVVLIWWGHETWNLLRYLMQDQLTEDITVRSLKARKAAAHRKIRLLIDEGKSVGQAVVIAYKRYGLKLTHLHRRKKR